MTLKYLNVISVIFLGVVLPNHALGLSLCKTDDPNFDSCLAKGVEDAVKSFKSGSSQFGLKPIDPLDVGKMTLGSKGGAVNLVQYYDGVLLHGLSDIKVTKAHYDTTKKTLEIETVYPKFTHQGHYRIDGAILALPVQGDGRATLELLNCKMNIHVQLDEINKNGQKYFKIKTWKNEIIPEKMRMNFENLFNGNKLLGDNINKVINEEWQVLYQDVQKDTEKSYGEVFRKYAQEFFDKVPINQIFL